MTEQMELKLNDVREMTHTLVPKSELPISVVFKLDGLDMTLLNECLKLWKHNLITQNAKMRQGKTI
jgi:hypothetical protein